MPTVANGFNGRFADDDKRCGVDDDRPLISPDMMMPDRAYATGIIEGIGNGAMVSVEHMLAAFERPGVRTKFSMHCRLALPEHVRQVRKHMMAILDLLKE